MFMATGATWTLTRGKVRLTMRPAPQIDGTWSIATVELAGEPNRSGVGDITFVGNRADFSDGCNRISQTVITGAKRLALVGVSRSTTKYCEPGSFIVADGPKLANAVFTVQTSGTNSLTLASSTGKFTLTR